MKFRTMIKISTNYMLNIKILEKIQFCRFFTCGVKKWAIVLTRVNFIFYSQDHSAKVGLHQPNLAVECKPKLAYEQPKSAVYCKPNSAVISQNRLTQKM